MRLLAQLHKDLDISQSWTRAHTTSDSSIVIVGDDTAYKLRSSVAVSKVTLLISSEHFCAQLL